MSYLLAIFLGAVQGVTEFLPVSSSGHLVLLHKILGVGETPIFFETLVHLGTLGAVLVFFRRELIRVIGEVKKIRGPARGGQVGVIRGIIIGTLPVAAVGFLVQQFLLEEIFGNLLVVGVGFLVTSALLLWSKKLEKGLKGLKGLKDTETLAIGLFQAAALVPGISRSGATIVGGLSQKLDREEAFKFSFYLAIPAIIGANLLQLKDLSSADFLLESLLGMLAAFVVGYFSLKLLQKILRAGKLYYFSFYCFSIGVLTILKILL
jgi:undecaprenyl-diphosphatase